MTSVALIMKEVAQFYNVGLQYITDRTRHTRFIKPRQVAMYLSRMLTNKSLPEIGRQFNRDHTTIIYGVDKITADLYVDRQLKAEIEAIKVRLAK